MELYKVHTFITVITAMQYMQLQNIALEDVDNFKCKRFKMESITSEMQHSFLVYKHNYKWN